MAKVQAKLKECVDKQSLKSLDHLSAQLATDAAPTDEAADVMQVPVEAGVMDVKGENKAPVKKRSKRKHKLAAKKKKEESSDKMQGVSTEKRWPRFFCQF